MNLLDPYQLFYGHLDEKWLENRNDHLLRIWPKTTGNSKFTKVQQKTPFLVISLAIYKLFMTSLHRRYASRSYSDP